MINLKKFSLAVIATILPILSIANSAIEIDGLYYVLEDSTACVVNDMYVSLADDETYGQRLGHVYTGDIVIPEFVEYEGVKYTVTSLRGGYSSREGDDPFAAFEDSKITSITIPKTIKTISDSAFRGCKELKSVVFEGPISHIGSWSFSGCTSLQSFTLPAGLESTGCSVFEGCTNLHTIILRCDIKENMYVDLGFSFSHLIVGKEVTVFNIDEHFSLYQDFHNLNSVTVENGNERFDSRENSNALISTKDNSLLLGCSNTIIPNSITSIAYNAFDGCTSLTSITIPNSVTSIGGCAFQGCSGLASITIPNSVTSIGENAFYGCSGLTSVTIPDGVTSIGYETFCNCTSLTTVSIPNSVTSIGGGAFCYCSGLTSVIIPNNVSYIGWNAFAGCSSLEDVYCLGDKAPYADGAFTENEVKETTLHVKDYAIESFKGIEPWTFFKEIKFEKVTDFKLTYFVDGEVYKEYTHKYEESITPEPNPVKPGYTFSGWSEIPETMPGKDVKVYGTFTQTDIIVDDVIYHIEEGEVVAVGSTRNNREINIASSVEDNGIAYDVTSIAKYAFKNKSGLTSVFIPSSVKIIGDEAFYGCSSLETITISEGIQSIGTRAFAKIDELNDVYCYAVNIPNTDRTAFENSYIDYVTLHVPEASVEAYKTTGPWSGFKYIVGIAGPKQCDMPTISFDNNKLTFNCDTPDAEYHYTITAQDAQTGISDEIELSATYNISVYASAEGYADSEVNIATLCWVATENTATNIEDELEVKVKPVLIQNEGNTLYISGIATGLNVSIYNSAGMLITTTKAQTEYISFDVPNTQDIFFIIKVGDQSIKYFIQ